MRDRTTEKSIRAYRRHYDIEFILGEMFYKQIERSKKHTYKTVSYTKSELIAWGLLQPNVYNLFTAWIESGHIKSLRPSVDRVDANKGYAFDNIQLITWGENDIKGRCEGKHNIVKPVLQFTKGGEFVTRWESAVAASKHYQPNLKHRNKSKIYNHLNRHKHYNSFHGYIFTYEEEIQHKELCRHEY